MPTLRVMVCGSPSEAPIVKEIVTLCNDQRVMSVAADLPLTRLIALTGVAHSMISIDTGPAHIAAAMDCPSVVLFGRHGWGRWCPRAPSSTVLPLGARETREQGSVSEISADDVLGAWKFLPARGAKLQSLAARDTTQMPLRRRFQIG